MAYTLIHCILLAIQRAVEKGEHVDAFHHVVVDLFRIQRTILIGTRTHHDYVTRLSREHIVFKERDNAN